MPKLISLLALAPMLVHAAPLPKGIEFHAGPGNVVTIIGTTSVYGIPKDGPGVRRVLLTHARRDVFPGGGGESIAFVVPAADRELFEDPMRFWMALETGRFHDYAQLGTKVPVRPVKVSRAVSGGEEWTEDGVRIHVLATPGYTRGAVSYVIETGGKRIACTGDLIYGDGQLFDLYSLQDAVPEAKAAAITATRRARRR